MRIIFCGSDNFSIPSLKLLSGKRKDIEIFSVVTKPDRRRGRGLKLQPTEFKKVAMSLGFDIYQPEKIDEPEVISHITSLKPEFIVVVAYGKILPGKILKIPSLGCINLHPSLLPELRGPGAIPYSIIRNYTYTGVTTMYLSEKMDAGDILFQQKVRIEPQETAGTLSEKLATIGANLLYLTLRELKKGRVTPTPQEESEATYAPPLKKEDGAINWSSRAEEIHNLVRGLDPWPSAYTYLEEKMIKIHRCTVDEYRWSKGEPGEIVEVTKDTLTVTTGMGNLSILEVQPENRRKMTIKEFLAGHRLKKGMKFSTRTS